MPQNPLFGSIFKKTYLDGESGAWYTPLIEEDFDHLFYNDGGVVDGKA